MARSGEIRSYLWTCSDFENMNSGMGKPFQIHISTIDFIVLTLKDSLAHRWTHRLRVCVEQTEIFF